MKKNRFLYLLTFGLMLANTASIYSITTKNTSSHKKQKSTKQSPKISIKKMQLNQGLRKLWSDHVFWTRLYIIAATMQSSDAQEAADRLFKNQEDLGNAIIPYYGADAGKKLTELLKDHIKIAANIVNAALAGDKKTMELENQKWKQNAEDIATFLSKANPHWQKETLSSMLNNHLALTAQELTDRLEKKWKDDINTFDKTYQQALDMADALTDGIVKQFPGKF